MPMNIVGDALGPSDSAQQLVYEAEVALEKPQKWNTAAIEVREIDPATEHASATVFGMLKPAPADHRNLSRRVEDCQVDRDLREVERRLVLGVEETRILQGYERGFAVALDSHLVKIDQAAAA